MRLTVIVMMKVCCLGIWKVGSSLSTDTIVFSTANRSGAVRIEGGLSKDGGSSKNVMMERRVIASGDDTETKKSKNRKRMNGWSEEQSEVWRARSKMADWFE